MAMQIKKATKRTKKLRLSISAPSGGGKTFGALTIANGLLHNIPKSDRKILVFDTEYGRASLKADHFGEFDVVEPETNKGASRVLPSDYIEVIRLAEENNYHVLILDSTTPEWEAIQDIHHKMEGKSSFQNWGKVKQTHHIPFINAILSSKLHIICTMRGKMEYAIEEDNGKRNVKTLGVGSQQDSNMPYFMDFALTISARNHLAEIDKAEGDSLNSPIYRYTQSPFLLTEQFGKDIVQWLESGANPQKDAMVKRVYELQTEYEQLKKEVHVSADMDLKSFDTSELMALGKSLRAEVDALKGVNTTVDI